MLTFRVATTLDAAPLAELVNAAYRPQGEPLGWTHENDLVLGVRIDAATLLTAIEEGLLVLVAELQGRLLACIELSPAEDACYLGMFSVLPEFQGRGVGKQVLAYAEYWVEQILCFSTIRIRVLSPRVELIAFYQRRGYAPTGVVMDYLAVPSAGQPRYSGLTVDVLEKKLFSNFAEGNV